MADFDLLIIGSGPGGYTGAIRAAQLGLKVGVVEKNPTFGGTCLNVGCIPSKALLDSSEHFSEAQSGFSHHGIEVSNLKIDISKMMKRKNKIVKDLTDGIAFLFKKNKITSIHGFGVLTAPNEVEVTDLLDMKTKYSAKNIMLATGSVPTVSPALKTDGTNVLTSTEALSFEKVPKNMVVVGGGVIGLELGSVWLRLGAKVTVVEFTDKLAGSMDTQMCKELQKVLKNQGFEFHLNSAVTGVNVKGPGDVDVTVVNNSKDEKFNINADRVLVSIGRRPYSEGLGLEALGIKKDQRGFVKINDRFQTNVPNVYAIGDLVRGPMLAHKAEEEGISVAEIIANGHGHVNYNTVPSVIYTWPELASVGMTEEEGKATGKKLSVGTFPFMANGRARAMGSTQGMVKIIADADTDRVLGVHILGARASDMIAEAVIAMEFAATSEDIARSFHAHPTLAEVMREAALAVQKRARQM